MQDRSREHEDNREIHERAILAAGRASVDYLLFPELSYTGYFQVDAGVRAWDSCDRRLLGLLQLAKDSQIIVSVGIPLRVEGKALIASAVLGADGTMSLYSKKFLHPAESEVYSTDSSLDPLTVVGDTKIAHAICIDIESPEHGESAVVQNAELYSAGIFYTQSGITTGRSLLSDFARSRRKVVAMANYCGPCWGVEAGGRSGLWDAQGGLVIDAKEGGEVLLVADWSGTEWSGSRFNLDVTNWRH